MPDIVEAILGGTQGTEVTLTWVLEHVPPRVGAAKIRVRLQAM